MAGLKGLGRLRVAQQLLQSAWLELRDGRETATVAFVKGAISALAGIAILTADEKELWLRRIETCPGHDDAGGRDWCAYCGKLKHEEDEADADQ